MARRFLTLVRLAVVPILALTGLALAGEPSVGRNQHHDNGDQICRGIG